MTCKLWTTSGHRLWTLMVKSAFLFLAVGVGFALASPVTSSASTSKMLTEDTSAHFLRVRNSIPSLGQSVDALSEDVPQQFKLCRYAGQPPQVEDISDLAMSWVCESVEDGAITLPQYVYKMKPHNPKLWKSMRQNCDCKEILYSIPYLRYKESTRTWTYSTRVKVPVGTSCPRYESESCTQMFENL